MKTNKWIIGIFALMMLMACGKKHDGHDHEGENHEHEKELQEKKEHDHEHEADEIVFTHEQAKMCGLTTETVQPSSFHAVIHTSGMVQAQQGDEQTIVATASGILHFNRTAITEGSPVGKGESIASISSKNIQDGDPGMKARFAYEAAEKEFRRAERLVADNIISTKQYEQARLNYETAKATYQGYAGGMTQGGITVSAPISGYVKTRLVAHGEYVAVGQPIAVVAQNRRLQLRADVPESGWGQLSQIQGANFKMSYDDEIHMMSKLNGRLLSYGKALDAASVYIPVTFEFDNIGNIIPGAYAEVYLLTVARPGVISVPLSALTEEQGLKFVYIQTGKEVYHKREVKTGQDDGNRIEIVNGLKAGDKVVTKGAYQLRLASSTTAIPDHGHSH